MANRRRAITRAAGLSRNAASRVRRLLVDTWTCGDASLDNAHRRNSAAAYGSEAATSAEDVLRQKCSDAPVHHLHCRIAIGIFAGFEAVVEAVEADELVRDAVQRKHAGKDRG